MAPGIKKLQRIQLGKETTAGTAVAATTRWRGAGAMLDDQRKIEEIEELVGIIDGADRTVVVQLLSMIELAPIALTFEQLQYLLVMGFGGPTTGTADGAGSGKIYQTTIPTTAVPTAVPYTIESGDNVEQEVAEYNVLTKLTLTGELGGTVKMSGTVMGRQVQRLGGGFTAVSIPALSTESVTSQGKIYLDAIGGTYGTTQVSGSIIGFKITITIGWIPQFTIDGQLYFTRADYTSQKVEGEISFLHDANASGSGGAKADFRAQTAKLLRIDLIGSALASAGTTYSTRHAIIDLPIKYLNPGPLDEKSGNNVVKLKFRSRYNLTAGNAGKFLVVNELASLP